MHILSAPICMRMAFSSGRNSRIRSFLVLYAFSPSIKPLKKMVLLIKLIVLNDGDAD